MTFSKQRQKTKKNPKKTKEQKKKKKMNTTYIHKKYRNTHEQKYIQIR